jgi:hypothetical protein
MPRSQSRPEVELHPEVDLEEFVRSRPWKGGAGSAWCCTSIPAALMGQVEAYVRRCRDQGISPRWKAVVAWLTEQGVEGATVARVQYHFDSASHARSAG